MSLITKMRKQKAVWWSIDIDASGGVVTDDYGQPVYNSPIEIACRWEDIAEEFIKDKDEKSVSSSVVYVDRDMKAGDVLLLGELDSGVDENNPLDNDGAMRIQKFSKIPNLKATEYLRSAYL